VAERSESGSKTPDRLSVPGASNGARSNAQHRCAARLHGYCLLDARRSRHQLGAWEDRGSWCMAYPQHMGWGGAKLLNHYVGLDFFYGYAIIHVVEVFISLHRSFIAREELTPFVRGQTLGCPRSLGRPSVWPLSFLLIVLSSWKFPRRKRLRYLISCQVPRCIAHAPPGPPLKMTSASPDS